MNDEGESLDFDTDLANEITHYALDLIEDFPEESKSEIIMEALVIAISKIMLAHRIMNPQITHKQIIEQVFFKIKSDFNKRAGADDFIMPEEILIN